MIFGDMAYRGYTGVTVTHLLRGADGQVLRDVVGVVQIGTGLAAGHLNSMEGVFAR